MSDTEDTTRLCTMEKCCNLKSTFYCSIKKGENKKVKKWLEEELQVPHFCTTIYNNTKEERAEEEVLQWVKLGEGDPKTYLYILFFGFYYKQHVLKRLW